MQQVRLFAAQRVSGFKHVLALRLHHSKQLHLSRHLLDRGQQHTEQLHLGQEEMLKSGSDDARQLHRQQGLHQFNVHKQDQLPKRWLHLGVRDMDAWRLDGGCLDAFDMDPEQSQHVEWLRDRSRDRDRAGNDGGNDQTGTAPSAGNASTLFYPEQYSLCSPAMRGLAYDWSAMKTAVDGLTPNGSTNQPIGLVSGWHSLAGIGPFTSSRQDFESTPIAR